MANANPHIGAGTRLLFDNDASGTADTLVPGIVDAGEWGDQVAFLETTAEDLTSRTYIQDLPEPVEVTIVANDMPGNADQQAFVALAQAYGSTPFVREYVGGRRASGTLELGGFLMQTVPIGGESQKWAVSARITGGITWAVV